jgi:hypothetical protein
MSFAAEEGVNYRIEGELGPMRIQNLLSCFLKRLTGEAANT